MSRRNKQKQAVGQGGSPTKSTTIKRLINGVQDTFFVMYARSFEQELFSNNKILIAVLLLLKQFQIISLLFIPQVPNPTISLFSLQNHS